MKFGEFLREQRSAKGWTQPQAASAIGIEQSYLSKLENGKAYPSEDTFDRLVAAYAIHIDDMMAKLFSGELDRLRDVQKVRAAVLDQAHSVVQTEKLWLIAGVALLVLGGGFLGLAQIEGGSSAVRYVYQSTGVILPGESLTVFDDLDDQPSPSANAGERERREALTARIDEETISQIDFKGPTFIEDVEDGRRLWRLVGGTEGAITKPFSWAYVPGFSFVIGGLGCFAARWRWPSRSEPRVS